MATAAQLAAIRKANACRNRHRRERGLQPVRFKSGSRVDPRKGPKTSRCGSRSYTKSSGGRKRKGGKRKAKRRACKKEVVYRYVKSGGPVVKGATMRKGGASSGGGLLSDNSSGPIFGTLFG